MSDITFFKLREKDCEFSYLIDFYMIKQIAFSIDLQPYYNYATDAFDLFPQYISPHINGLISALWSHGYFDKE